MLFEERKFINNVKNIVAELKRINMYLLTLSVFKNIFKLLIEIRISVKAKTKNGITKEALLL